MGPPHALDVLLLRKILQILRQLEARGAQA
jgi:hypothetical protein